MSTLLTIGLNVIENSFEIALGFTVQTIDGIGEAIEGGNQL